MYSALAHVYDLFYDDDSAARAEYYRGFIDGGEGVDIGCGTGALTVALMKTGLKIYGVDSSPIMLDSAVKRAQKEGADIKFVLGQATCVPAAHKLDFAIAANDVYNYVQDIASAFASAYKTVKSGGIFAFDISSEYKLKNVLAGNTFSETKNDVTYIWQNFKKGNKLIIDFTVFSPSNQSYIKTCETQVQYIRSAEEIERELKKAGFLQVKQYAFGKKRKPDEKTERILFIAK